MSMRRLMTTMNLIVVWPLLTCVTVGGSACGGEIWDWGNDVSDKVLLQARQHLWRSRDTSLHILENAVRKFPNNVAYWAELIHTLSVNSDYYFAERASREALRLNPGVPKLLVARARLLKPSPALDVLDVLEKVPGNAEEARRLKEILRLGFPIPENRNDYVYEGRAASLIYLKRLDRALEVLDEGLSKSPVDRNLLALKAIVVALQGQFDKCMELQKASGYLQVEIDGSYWGLGDCLLQQGRPALTIQSFGGNEPGGEECARAVAGRRSLARRTPRESR